MKLPFSPQNTFWVIPQIIISARQQNTLVLLPVAPVDQTCAWQQIRTDFCPLCDPVSLQPASLTTVLFREHQEGGGCCEIPLCRAFLSCSLLSMAASFAVMGVWLSLLSPMSTMNYLMLLTFGAILLFWHPIITALSPVSVITAVTYHVSRRTAVHKLCHSH